MRHTYLGGLVRKYLVIQHFIKGQLEVIKQNKNSNKRLNIPLAHDNKDLYKTLMHPCIGVCVERKLVPLIFSKLSS